MTSLFPHFCWTDTWSLSGRRNRAVGKTGCYWKDLCWGSLLISTSSPNSWSKRVNQMRPPSRVNESACAPPGDVFRGGSKRYFSWTQHSTQTMSLLPAQPLHPEFSSWSRIITAWHQLRSEEVSSALPRDITYNFREDLMEDCMKHSTVLMSMQNRHWWNSFKLPPRKPLFLK